MSYSNPTVVSHSWTDVDFGTGSPVADSFQGPTGLKGYIISVSVSATEVFTTGGDVLAGVAAAGADYINFPLLTLAATDTLVATDAQIVLRTLPADTQIEVTWNDTGGTPTGIGTVTIVVAWF